MIKERLQPDSTVGIFAPVRKLQLNGFKKHLRKVPVKLKDRIVQLGDDANICRKIGTISKSMETDCNKIISNHKLTITPRCLVNRTRFLYSEYKGKSKLLSVLKKSTGITSSISLSEIYCVAVGGFVMLHLLQKTEQIKASADLVNTVCLWVENKKKFCSTIIIAFNTYQEMPLKSATRNERDSKSNPQHYNNSSSTNVSHQSVSQLLDNKKANDPC